MQARFGHEEVVSAGRQAVEGEHQHRSQRPEHPAAAGAGWLAQYKPYIEDGETVVASPHKAWGPQTSDLVFQLRKRRVSGLPSLSRMARGR